MKLFVYPGNIEAEIRAVGAGEVPYMRTTAFSDVVRECGSVLQKLADNSGGRWVAYTASGTAAMEACVTGFVATCSSALVIDGGTFGARWADLCRYHRIPHAVFSVAFGAVPDLERLEDVLRRDRHDVLLMQHHETSSGLLFDLPSIASICRRHGTFLVVDAIGSFLSDSFSMRQFGVDLAVLSSQKGLNLPPGLSFVLLGERVSACRRFGATSFYLDWTSHLRDMERGQTPFSPATLLFLQLHRRLGALDALGAGAFAATTAAKAAAFRADCVRRGWSFSAAVASNSLTGLRFSFPVRPLVDALQRRGIYVLPSPRHDLIRVTHTGCLGIPDHLELVKEIDAWMQTESALSIPREAGTCSTSAT